MTSKKKPSPLVATLSGAISGMIETTAIWPMEYVKTHLQLQQKAKNPKYTGMISCAQYTIKHHGVLGLYRGLLPVLLGSIPKAGIRFGGFNMIQTYFQQQNLKKYGVSTVNPIQDLIAGTIAGAVESTFAVTPIETVKTKLIHSHQGFISGFLGIIKTEGIRGVYQGWAATTLKQSSNQGLRFMFFSFYKKTLLSDPNQSLNAFQALIGGMLSGCFSTICNNPFDMAKTRMQGLHAGEYNGFVHCVYSIARNEGVLALWQGVGPRLARVVPGQGIIFMSFEKISEGVQKMLGEK